MLQDLISGLVVGAIYALAATGLVITYTSSGVLNFAFGGMAYFVARAYYYLHVQQSWGTVGAALVSILVLGPAMGAVLYLVLFRFLQRATELVKIVATVGLSVVFPPLAALIFGIVNVAQAPGLAPVPVRVFHPFGAAVTLDEVIVLVSVVAVLALGGVMLRYTRFGLLVRALVESPALAALSGANPVRGSLAVWSMTTFLSGLAGVLLAPIVGLSSQNYSLLVSAAFTAVLVARFRHLGRAISVAVLLGVVVAVLQRYLPTQGVLSQEVTQSVPFAILLVFLIAQTRRSTGRPDQTSSRGLLDQAIRFNAASQQGAPPGAFAPAAAGIRHRLPAISGRRTLGMVATIAVILVASAVLSDFWLGIAATGLCFGVVFLSFTLLLGEGGMIWLCQTAFAGVGAVATGQLVSVHGWPLLPAVVVASLIVAPAGLIVGYLTTRLGDLYVALVTMSFGILIYNLVLSLAQFSDFGTGYAVPRPFFAVSNRAFLYFVLVIFCLVGLVIEHLRRSTAGLALAAVRTSEIGAKSIGLGPVGLKVSVALLGSVVASLGGALVAMGVGFAVPTTYETLGGLVWLAVLVTVGIRSNVAAAIAGLAFSVLPAVFQVYLSQSQSFAQLPPLLFGVGAVLVARNPEGVLASQSRKVGELFAAAQHKVRDSRSYPPVKVKVEAKNVH